MLTTAQLQQLKRINISIDGPKTQERVEALWKTAPTEQKQAILDLASVIAATVYRAYRTGSISIKLVISFAQTLMINPFYLTGEVDEPGEFSDGSLRELLLKYKYNKIVAEAGLKRSYKRNEIVDIAADAPKETEVAEPEAEEASQPAPQAPVSAELTIEEIYVLLQRVMIKSKAGIPTAKDQLEQVKQILLS